MAPAILVTVGVLFLVDTMTEGRLEVWHRTWPILLIVIGAIKLAQRSASTAGHIEPTYPGYVPVQPVQPIQPMAIQTVQPVPPSPQGYQAPAPPAGNEPQAPSSEVNNG